MEFSVRNKAKESCLLTSFLDCLDWIMDVELKGTSAIVESIILDTCHVYKTPLRYTPESKYR